MTISTSLPATYEICLGVRLAPDRAGWFDEMTITYDNGGTRLIGQLPDQAALHGILAKIRDMGLPLISVVPIKSD
jgi:hypothetical protein